MKKSGQIIFLVIVVGILILIFKSNWVNIKRSFKPPELIIAKVTLNNECSIISESFILVHIKTKRYSTFSNNLARLKVHEGDLVKLAISPKYPEFVYSGEAYKAKSEMTITANCQVDPRMRSIFNSMRDQFN